MPKKKNPPVVIKEDHKCGECGEKGLIYHLRNTPMGRPYATYQIICTKCGEYVVTNTEELKTAFKVWGNK